MSVFSIHHITRYEYSRPVKEGLSLVKLYPAVSAEQEVLKHEVVITGSPELHLFPDYWGNLTGVFNIAAPHRELVIDSRLTVRVLPAALPFLDKNFVPQAVEASPLLLAELRQPENIRQQETISSIAGSIARPGKSTAAVIQECSEYIFSHFNYIKGITSFETTVDEILEHKSGVCQDFAHVLLQLLRTSGIACRYVSGYICPNKNGMRGEGATHAWVEAWIPGHGWAGTDPTNNVWVQQNHVKLAVGRNFGDCSPVKGTFRGTARQALSVYVSVGYEDGHTFEEVNLVGTGIAPDPDEELVPEAAAGQEQQQQQ